MRIFLWSFIAFGLLRVVVHLYLLGSSKVTYPRAAKWKRSDDVIKTVTTLGWCTWAGLLLMGVL